MSIAHTASLPDRGVVRLSGPDAGKLLQDLITNDMDGLEIGSARHAALLSPQGKILFEFFVVSAAAPDNGTTYLLETARAQAPALAKRLIMYKLRAKAEIADVSGDWDVYVAWFSMPSVPVVARRDEEPRAPERVLFDDPRNADLGVRILVPSDPASKTKTHATAAEYHAHRIALGVPEAGLDYTLGDTFPHEANFDLLAGASFTKGCYIGQEVVSRMQNKTVVRKRVVRIAAATQLASGAEVRIGDATIGKIGSVDGHNALAMVRLDRVAEAIEKGQQITVDGHPVTIDAAALARYRQSVIDRPVIDL